MRAWTIIVLLAVGCGGGGDPGPMGGDAGTDRDGATPDGSVDDGGPVDPCEADPESCVPPETCDDDPCPEGERCLEEGDAVVCECPAGSERRDGACVELPSCTPTTCDGHGTCSDEGGVVECACDLGYAGDRCGECDAGMGYLRHSNGECVLDLCDPNPCEDAGRTLCRVEGGAATCACDAGTHDEDGVCVEDVTCSATTCSGRGECSEDMGTVSCVCDAGAAGRFCDECDEMAGYHPDGMGGCTTDPCLPNPCTSALETVCVVVMDEATCECDAGAHREGGVCVVDEVCEASTCGAGGTCSVVMGVTECACDAGWTGERCDACDDAMGYHPDGVGGCTTDPCLPNPCTGANQTVCMDDAGSAVCSCDAGYHPDGVGGCTDDPCVPHPCGDQACRDAGDGTPECFTPVCDDDNPCTDDTVELGSCVFTPVGDGTTCSTTLCTSGQICTAGTCGGGSAVTCDDGNPCTTDACDDVSGCFATDDDALVPDDGWACTVDSCSGGVASHVATDGLCDDGAFCNGAERCVPGSGADAMGCVGGDAPAPPGPSTPCARFGACDEGSDDFPLTVIGAGMPCDDGISCTTGDTCQTTGGLCLGTPLTTCPTAGTGCVSTTPLSTDPVNVPVARVSGAITVNGAPLPSNLANTFGGFDLLLVNRETRQRHFIGRPSYSSSGGRPLTAGSDVIDALLVPGVYDLVYDRGHDDGSSTIWPWVGQQRDPGEFPNGYAVLREVVLGAGDQTLDVDVPVTRLSGDITVDGAPLPSNLANTFGGFDLLLVNRETQQRHFIGRPSYSSSGGRPLTAGSDVIDAILVPGAYDLVYDRGHDDGSDSIWPWVGQQRDPGEFPNGYVVLQENVVLGAGAQTLDVDVPVTRLSGAITVDGAALPSNLANTFGGFDLLLVNQATKQRHFIGRPSYSSSGGRPLTAGSDVVDAVLVPGTYDLVYDRGHDDGSWSIWPWVGQQRDPGEFPNGYVVLQEDVVLAAGAQTLDVDVPVTRLSGAITVNGAPLPSNLANTFGGFDLLLVNRETEQRHFIGRPSYSSSGGRPLTAGSDVIDAVLVPGAYDLVYDRGHDDGSESIWAWVGQQRDPGEFPNGYVVLQENVVIAAGSQTLDVDVPVARVSGAITVDGAPLPSNLANTFGGFDLILVDPRTGQRHFVGRPSYSSSGGRPLTAGSDVIDAVLVPGSYDLYYDRGHDDGSETIWSWVGQQKAPGEFPNGYVLLEAGGGDPLRHVDSRRRRPQDAPRSEHHPRGGVASLEPDEHLRRLRPPSGRARHPSSLAPGAREPARRTPRVGLPAPRARTAPLHRATQLLEQWRETADGRLGRGRRGARARGLRPGLRPRTRRRLGQHLALGGPAEGPGGVSERLRDPPELRRGAVNLVQ